MHAQSISQLNHNPQTNPTEFHHLAMGVGGAVGCTLANQYIVDQGWLSSEHSSIALALLGAGAMFAGWKYDQPALTWTAAGWTFAGVAQITKDLATCSGDSSAETETEGTPNADDGDSADASDSDELLPIKLIDRDANSLYEKKKKAGDGQSPAFEVVPSSSQKGQSSQSARCTSGSGMSGLVSFRAARFWRIDDIPSPCRFQMAWVSSSRNRTKVRASSLLQ